MSNDVGRPVLLDKIRSRIQNMLRKKACCAIISAFIGFQGLAIAKPNSVPEAKSNPVPVQKVPEVSGEKEVSTAAEEKPESSKMKITSVGVQATAKAANALSLVPTKSKYKHWGNTTVGLGHFESSVDAQLYENLNGTVTFETDDPEAMELNEALAEWELHPFVLIFGQQDFNFGLLPTHEVGSRTISEPPMQEGTEFNAAGATLVYDFEPFSIGIAGSSVTTIAYFTGRPSVHPCIIANADFAPEGQIARISFLGSSRRQAVDGAVNLKLGSLLLDWETMIRLHDEIGVEEDGFLNPTTDPLETPKDDHKSRVRKGGMSAGLSWQVTPMFQPCIRYDIIGDRDRYMTKQLITAGFTCTPIKPLFFGAEASYNEKKVPFFALQIGYQAALDFE